MCLVARYLESIGIPTLCLGSARDILVAGAPPRAVFVDYPLGHSAGRPFDAVDQLSIVSAAITAFEAFAQNDGVLTLPNQWPEQGWQSSAMNPAAGDTRSVRDTSPQWQYDEDRIAAAR